MPVFQIKEYGKIKSSEDYKESINCDSEIVINDKAFNSIWSYVLEFQSKGTSIDKAFKLFTKNGKKQIQVQNFVGIIETQDKTVIEILPKIFSQDGELGITACKKIFLKLVASSANVPYISFQQAGLDTVENFPILEVFIDNYILEIEQLLLKGLKNDYTKVEQNSEFLKGQLLFSKDILRNLIDKSKFYTRFTRYHVDIPQNRIIKSTLFKLFNITLLSKNKARLRKLILMFSDISPSKNVTEDLKIASKSSRLFSAYEKALFWSEQFLLDKSFTSFSGDKINQAILFPMERLFEEFVTKQFRKFAKQYLVHAQGSRHFLVDQHNGKSKFKLKPDLYMQARNFGMSDIIADTKWKIIDAFSSDKNYLISQTDMYQLYAYGKKYSNNSNVVKLALIYPLNKNFLSELPPFFYEKPHNNSSLELLAIPFDLSGEYENQINSILSRINQ